MTSALLIGLMIVLYTLQSFFCKVYSDSYPGDPNRSSTVFNTVSGLVVAVVSFCMIGFQFKPAWQTLLLGILNAVVLIAYNTFLIGASQRGPYSVLMVFMLSGGILVPAVVSLFLGDRLSVLQWLAVALIILAIWLVSYKPEEGKAKSRAFFPICVGLFLANGLYGTLLDVQQRWTGAGDKEEMVILTYLVASVLSFAVAAVSRRRALLSDFRQTKKSLLFLILCSLIMTSAIHLLVYILPLVNVTVLYTFDNAGVLLFSVICSCIFFKEKLSLYNIIGCIVMCAGLVGMAIF